MHRSSQAHRTRRRAAQRADNEQQLRLEFEQKLRELDALAGTLGLAKHDAPPPDDKPAPWVRAQGARPKEYSLYFEVAQRRARTRAV